MSPSGEKPSVSTINALAKAFDFMKYDVALLANGEAEELSDSDVKLDANRMTAAQESFTTVTSQGGDLVGFLRFPSLAKGKDIPSEDEIKKISRIIKNKRDSVKLLIGLSDWGWVGEREYLAQNPDAVPDLLLGSGLGSGSNGRIESNGRCVWIRPYDKGRTVSEIQIFAWPDHSKPFGWKEPEAIKTLSIGLGDQYNDNQDVSAILQ